MDNEKNVLIFDFDGTIVDSGLAVYEVVHKITPRFGTKNNVFSDKVKFRNLSSKEIVRHLGVSWYKLPIIYLRFRREYSKLLKKQKPVSGIAEVIKELGEKGTMHIVSGNSKGNIRWFLKENNIQYFKLVEVVFGFFGKSIAIKKIIRKENLNPKNIIYIGDETRDIEAAHRAGVRSAAVIWGVNSKEILEKYEPDFLIEKPEDLLNLIN